TGWERDLQRHGHGGHGGWDAPPAGSALHGYGLGGESRVDPQRGGIADRDGYGGEHYRQVEEASTERRAAVNTHLLFTAVRLCASPLLVLLPACLLTQSLSGSSL